MQNKAMISGQPMDLQFKIGGAAKDQQVKITFLDQSHTVNNDSTSGRTSF